MSQLYYVVVGSNGAARQTAQLQGVAVTGLIRDAVAEYTMIQTYVNPLPNNYIDGAYTFPLYEGVAVVGFQAEVDERKIVGKVAEKVAAMKEYEEAVKDGKTASLLEHEKPDVFQACIGNIPPGKTISIRITLVAELKQDAGENQVRFVLPTTVAPRSSSGFTFPVSSGRGFGYPDSNSLFSVPASKISVNMACAMSKPITSVQSPSHTIEVHLGSTETTSWLESYAFDPNRARVSLTEDALLDRDLVIVIQSLELDRPRVLVERHPKDKTHAISLTFQPRFALQPLQASELVFLVDIHKEDDVQIKRAREALELLLRYIPFENHYFNVIGRSHLFGSTYQALFPASIEINAESLTVGIQYAQRFNGTKSGPEIGSAFQEVFQSRRRDVPMQIFLLTDGQISNVEQLGRAISNAVDDGKRSNQPLRVFSLGLGDSVSHHLIESVARAGQGYAQVVMAGERMEKKVFNMLKAGLTPPVTETSIQWTDSIVDNFVMVGGEDGAADDLAHVNKNVRKPLINLFSESESPAVISESTPPPEISATIYQAPFKLPVLCPGARFTVYAILSPTTPLPKELVLRGVSSDGPVELRVKVESVVEGETMLHSLAARALVRDFEEASSSIHALGKTLAPYEKLMLKHLGVSMAQREGQKRSNILPLSFNHVAEITKQKLIDIGETYSLSTKYTSWVAIDEDGPRNARDVTPASLYLVNVAQSAPQVLQYCGNYTAPPPTPCFGHTTPTYGATSLFSQATPAFSSFGASQAASSSGVFGAPQCQQSFSGCTLGATPAPVFGASPAPAYSGFQASSASAFGATPAPAFGGFQAPSTATFGATPAPAFGGFQAPSTATFGATPAPAFGGFQAPSTATFGATPAPAFGGFQAPSTATFGATPAPAFGGFQAPSTAAFGATPAPAFGGFQAPSTAAFGAMPAPAFGGFQAPSTAAFGAMPAPAFGGFQAPSTAAFGATPASAFEAPKSPAFDVASSSGGFRFRPVQGSPSWASTAQTVSSPFSSSTSLFGSQAPQSSPLDQAATTSSDPHTRLRPLLQHQLFDGLFPLVPAIAALFDTSVDNLKTKLGQLKKQCAGLIDLGEKQLEAIWATCLAVEFIMSKPKGLQDEWKLVVEKAERRVESLVKNGEHLARFKAAAKAS